MATYKGIGYETATGRTRTGTSSDDISFDSLITATDGVSVTAVGLTVGAGGANVTGGTTTDTLTVTGDASVAGDLTVTGDIISRGAVDLVVQDNFIDLNFANSTTTAESGGLTIQMNRNSGFTASTVTTFVAGSAGVSNPTFTNTDAGSSSLLAAGDVVVMTGATQEGNNGLYVVQAVNQASFPQTVTIKGVGTTSTDAATPWAQTQFEAESGATASAFKTDMFVQLVADGTTAFTDSGGSAYSKGTFLTAYHANATETSFSQDGGYTTVESTLQSAYNGGNTITTTGSSPITFNLAADAAGLSVQGSSGGDGIVSIGGTNAVHSFTVDASGAASSITATGQNLTLQTASSGTLTASSAGALALSGAATTLTATAGLTANLSGAASTITSTSQKLTLQTSGSGDIDIISVAAVDLDCVALELNSTDNSNLTLTGDAAADKTLTIAATNTGDGDGKIDMDADGDIDITSGANLDLDGVQVQINATNNSNLSLVANTASTQTLTIAASNADGSNVAKIDVDSDGDIDLTAVAALDLDAANVEIDATAAVSVQAATSSDLSLVANVASDQTLTIVASNANGGNVSNIDIDADGAVTINGAGSAKFGDDVATLDFNGAGAVTETGMTSFTITPSGALTLQGGGASTFGDDTGTIVFNGSGAVTTSGITTMAVTPSSTLDLDAGGAVTIDGASVLVGDDGNTAGVSLLSTSGNMQLETATSGNISITSVGTFGATSTAYDIDASSAFTLDAATVTIGGDSDTGNITLKNSSGVVTSIEASAANARVEMIAAFPQISRRITKSGTVAIGDCVFLGESGGSLVVTQTDADAIATGRFFGVAKDTTATPEIIFSGIANAVTCDDTFSAATHLGAPVYLSTNAGKITVTPPSAAGDVVFQVGLCVGGSGVTWQVAIQPQFIMEIG